MHNLAFSSYVKLSFAVIYFVEPRVFTVCRTSSEIDSFSSQEMKKLFDKARLEYKFKKAGDGHKLNEEDNGGNRPSASQQNPVDRSVPTASAQRAGQVL